jgi:transposase
LIIPMICASVKRLFLMRLLLLVSRLYIRMRDLSGGRSPAKFTPTPIRTRPGSVGAYILDNYAAHKHAKVREWLGRHPRFTFHFTPTSCSWLNAVEGFFAKLTNRRLKRGVFHSLIDLQAAINRFLAEHNESPKPFVWTADPDKIIAAVRRGHQVLDSCH